MSNEDFASLQMKEYFNSLETYMQNAYKIAQVARKKNFDPTDQVEITLAKNMAERVVGLISVVAPQIKDSKAVERIQEFEAEYGALDWRVAFKIAEEIAKGNICEFSSKKEAMEVGIRTGFAYVTVGVVSSPIEGFTHIDIKKRLDGQGEYFAINFAGPVRNAGGTAAAVCVLIADYVRRKMGYAQYDATDDETNRAFTEISDYHDRVTNLQYFPSKEEMDYLMKRIPVEIAGDASEKIEVSNYKDLPRVPENRIRSGVCLILSSCVPLKAPKLWKQLSKWGKEFEMEQWDFLEEFLAIQKKAKSKGEKKSGSKLAPDYTYIADLVAGRPVFGYPMRPGGFRLRYGRSRVSGFSAQSIHPASMHVMKNFVTTATQLKVERPGKAAAMTVCDSVEGPVVRLKDGSVYRLETEHEAKRVKKDIEKVLFLGDTLINYGDFFNRAHSLIPAGYCEEWWIQELEKAILEKHNEINHSLIAQETQIDEQKIRQIFSNPIKEKLTAEQAIILSKKYKIPLHPYYTFHYNLLEKEEYSKFISYLKEGKIHIKDDEKQTIEKIVMPLSKEKALLEKCGIPHLVINHEFVVFDSTFAPAIYETFHKEFEKDLSTFQGKPLTSINETSTIFIRDKSGVFIGARMGRPEKAKMRKMLGSPHGIFPVGDEGGRMKTFQSALEVGRVKSAFPLRVCKGCGKKTIYNYCSNCNIKTQPYFACRECGEIYEKCDHTPADNRIQIIELQEYVNEVLKKLDTRSYPDLIKGVHSTVNKEHMPEHLIKAFLRAKHDVYVNKDGTTRYDASEVPITHFKPKEIGVSIQRLNELGYTTDCRGNQLTDEDQVLELKPQDIILPCSPASPEDPADKVMINTTKFIDELLEKQYGLPAFYNVNTRDELAGHLVIGLAPHTSAGTLCRILGYSQTQSFYAHPLVHAAMRRDCDGDESCFFLLMDAFLNFSQKYLSGNRGSTMDAPLVLTSILTPSEVDDMVFDIDTVWKYPLEFYEATLEFKMPWELKFDQVNHFLGTPRQYEGYGYTHETENINHGVLCSDYKLLPSMQEKLTSQMELAEMLTSVSPKDVAALVIEKHFLKDIKGNLRKFSMQKFRCVNCNESFRRPPLAGKCTKCKTGKIIFTIAQGSVAKYLEPSISLAEKYNVEPYLKQTIELTKQRFEDYFGKEKEKQTGLGAWFG